MTQTQFYIAMSLGFLTCIFAVIAQIIIYKDYIKLKKEINEFKNKPRT